MSTANDPVLAAIASLRAKLADAGFGRRAHRKCTSGSCNATCACRG
jgi:hypothetical protein